MLKIYSHLFLRWAVDATSPWLPLRVSPKTKGKKRKKKEGEPSFSSSVGILVISVRKLFHSGGDSRMVDEPTETACAATPRLTSWGSDLQSSHTLLVDRCSTWFPEASHYSCPFQSSIFAWWKKEFWNWPFLVLSQFTFLVTNSSSLSPLFVVTYHQFWFHKYDIYCHFSKASNSQSKDQSRSPESSEIKAHSRYLKATFPNWRKQKPHLLKKPSYWALNSMSPSDGWHTLNACLETT